MVSSTQNMISIEGLSKSFGSTKALDNLNLGVKKGELLGIIGPNGAGKTTAIRITCCILKPDQGDVLVDGYSTHKDPLKIKSIIGYLPEEPNLYERFKARDLLIYFSELYGAGAAPVSITATVHVTVLPAPSASISGVIFNDADANGSLDAGEGGLAGVVVQLQDANGSELGTFTTGADGAYTFTALDAGSYQVYAPKDADRVQTTQNPIAVTLAEAQAATGVNIGSVVSADLKVSMTYTVNSKKIIYAITVTNDGPADALLATLTDALPDTVAYISVISTQGACSGGKTINCDFGTIASGGSVTVTIQVNRVNTKIPVVNTATASSSVFDIEMVDNSVSTTIP